MGNCTSETKEDVITIPSHKIKMTSHYTVVYPEHKKRTNSSLYNKTHNELSNLPCFICGKTKKKDNIIIETHHFYCEKAGTNGIDWIKFGEFAQNCYNIQTGEHIGSKFDWEKVEKNPEIFVDSKYNMITLCLEHHRSGTKGIHHVPFPEWILQKNAKKGFMFLV
jgi:hypothetical protein